MDFNKFIKKAQEKYSNNGVNFIDISVWDNKCSIYLRKVNTDIVLAHCSFSIPLNEKEVFKCLDKWFNDKSKEYKEESTL